MSTYILGIYTGHNATASLMRDGEIIACVSEERFNGVKNYVGFPQKSIEWCVNFAGITSQEISLVAYSTNTLAPIFLSGSKVSYSIKILSTIYLFVSPVKKLWGKFVYKYPKFKFLGNFIYVLGIKTVGQYTIKKELQYAASFLKISTDKVITFDHHLTHAATGYYSSQHNQDKALVFTLDGEGNLVCSTIYIFQKTDAKLIAKTPNEFSLGWMYHEVTRYLGMKPNEHEYKVMGLAPYAKRKDVQKLYEKIKGIITLDPKNRLQFSGKFNMRDTYKYLRNELEGYRFDNIAGAFQKLLEDRIAEWIENAIQKTKIADIICSGGVFMNVKANQKITEIPSVKSSFFMPSAGDESLPIGACFLAYVKLLEFSEQDYNPKPLKDLYLGPSFSNTDIDSFLEKGNYYKKYNIQKIENIEKRIAELLAKDKVVGRLAGKMEFGARALGNRSILANPKNPDLVMIINEQMKNRDFWMPFTPTILWERMKDYCINPKKIFAPYMTLSLNSTPLAQKELKAALHPYDFTLRPQMLKEDWNPKYYKIIKEFEKLTGIGGVLNTSFNLHGFPIVLGPQEAMHAFENSGLEYLVLENFLISKKI